MNERIKTLLTVFVTFGITMMFCIGHVNNITNDYEKRLEVKDQNLEQFYENYDQKINEVTELKQEYEELEDQVYYIVNGENYDVTIEHEGKAYRYKGEKKKFFWQ